MNPAGLVAVAGGAVLGAWARWGLSLGLNAINPALPYGTLLANLGGGFLIGVAVALFDAHPALSPEWRLFAVTGFLGALTTFSTFSAESVMLLQGGQLGAAALHSVLHLAGSILATFAGIAAWRAFA